VNILVVQRELFFGECIAGWLADNYSVTAMADPEDADDLPSCVAALCDVHTWRRLRLRSSSLPIVVVADTNLVPSIPLKPIQGIITTDTPLSAARAAITLVVNGGTIVSPGPVEMPTWIAPELTGRQRQVARYLSMKNQEIADELNVGFNTVQQHVVKLCRRLNVKNRTEALVMLADRASKLAQHGQFGIG
jgi:DNA-binding NarL/FixJ family response regulator